MNVSNILWNSAVFFPDRPAIRENNREITYAALRDRVARIASGLIKTGLRPGDFVALCAPNSMEWVEWYFAVMAAGGVAVPLPSTLTEPELNALIAESQPSLLWTTPDRLFSLKSLSDPDALQILLCNGTHQDLNQLAEYGTTDFRPVDRDRRDICAVLFTGGTTGIPKGAMLSHENILTAITNVVSNERSLETDCSLCFLPLNHVFGQMHILNATLLSGGCVELMPSFEMNRVLDLLAFGRVTKLFAVPTVYVRLLSLPDLKKALGSIRYCFSAAASMAEELVRQWKNRTGLAIHEAYGMTESASMVTYNHPVRHVIGSVGTPVGTVEIQIRDTEGNVLEPGKVGEICIRGRNIMNGYLNRPDETCSVFWENWFRSGDMGRIDSEGYLYIVDRLKDMIITGGENVYPREIEELLYMRPEIQECTVIGLPDPEWGERIIAYTVPAPGRMVDGGELKDFLKSRLSRFKVPKEFRIVETLPKSPAGKILKRELRNQVAETGLPQRRCP